MKRQLDIFLTAVMFFTRLHVPKRIHHDAGLLQQSPRYFPWVGVLVGGIAAIAYLITDQIFSQNMSVLFSMVTSILVTGAFHEDGFADVCDGFGGGWTKEKILLIMKDSRLGTFGVIGLIAILAFKFLLLNEISEVFNPIQLSVTIVAGHAVSRLAALPVIHHYQYVTGEGSKSLPFATGKLKVADWLIAFAGTVLPLSFIAPVYLVAVFPVLLTSFWAGRYFNKWIGGYTGDCLGAIQQLGEIAFYTTALILWKFI